MIVDTHRPEDEASAEQARLRHQAERNAQYHADWWTRYNQYLASPAWQQKRALVLQRDNFLCQACRLAKASEVHHLSYAHLGNEPLVELVAVCRDCHNGITAMDRRRRG